MYCVQIDTGRGVLSKTYTVLDPVTVSSYIWYVLYSCIQIHNKSIKRQVFLEIYYSKIL